MKNPFKKEEPKTDPPKERKREVYIHQDLVRVRRDDSRARQREEMMRKERQERERRDREDPRDRAWGRRNK